MKEEIYERKVFCFMEMLPAAVQALIAWLEFIYATILTFFRKKNSDEE